MYFFFEQKSCTGPPTQDRLRRSAVHGQSLAIEHIPFSVVVSKHQKHKSMALIYTRTHICTYSYTDVHMFVHTFVCMHIRMHIFTWARMQAHVYLYV